MEINKNCTECDKWFEFHVRIEDDQPAGFEDWSKGITQCKYWLYLPDNTKMTVKMYIDMNGVLDDYALTNYLVNRYNEI